MAKTKAKDEDKKIFDPEKAMTAAMTEFETMLNTVAEKVRDKREELEKKGLNETVKDTMDKVQAGSQAIWEQAQEDAKKLRKSVDEMLKDL
jgi:hypothetical protein